MTRHRVRGCLLGAVVGDALAFPFSGLSPVFTGALRAESVQRFKPHRSGRYPAGQASALSQLTAAVAEAICEEGPDRAPELVGSYLFPLARDRVLVDPPQGLVAALEAWARGRSDAVPIPEVPPVHLLPLALAERESEDGVVEDMAVAARCSGQDSPDALALGAAFFSSVRYSLRAGEVVLGDLLDVARGAAGVFSRSVADRIDTIPDLLYSSRRDGAASSAPEPVSGALSQVVAGLISFLKSPYDCERGYLVAQRSGGGCLAAFVCGALSGGFNGEESIPQELQDGLVMRDDIGRYLNRMFQRSSSEVP